MRILIIGENREYESLLQSTETGKKSHVEFAGYKEAMERTFLASIVFVEADIGNPRGFQVGRTVLLRFPGTVLIFLMKECIFEYSMAAMRMGAKNILVGSEINTASLEQLLCQYKNFEPEANRAMIARNFERMLLLRGEGGENTWDIQTLNNCFGMKSGKKQFFVMIVTSLDFVLHQTKADTLEKKVYSERIKEHLLLIRDETISIPFVFYIDQLFYLVVLQDEKGIRGGGREQTEQLQNRVCQAGQAVLGDQQILLCSSGKTNFEHFQGCLDELEHLEKRMHCGAYPCMLNSYNAGETAACVSDMDTLLEEAHQAVTAISEGREYEALIRRLFSVKNMEQITFSQFMKLKKRVAFELESLYKKVGGELADRKQMDETLERLQVICNYVYARTLILEIARELTACLKKRYNPLVLQCIRLVSEQYASDISLQEMAEQLNVSNVYLSALFRRETGKKYSTYVNEYRLEKARELIDEDVYPMSMVFEKVGFANQQYFSNCFKKVYGVTPGEYKRREKRL